MFADAIQTMRRHVNYTAQELSSIILQFADNQKIVSCLVLRPADAAIDNEKSISSHLQDAVMGNRSMPSSDFRGGMDRVAHLWQQMND